MLVVVAKRIRDMLAVRVREIGYLVVVLMVVLVV